MEPTKEFLLTFGGRAIAEIIEQGIEQEREQVREREIMNARRKMGFTVAQIANLTDYSAEYIQFVLDKYGK